ncbi:hypothetical protein B0H66DRAFT_573050 [Apodospora peruviana]|uniref:DUF427 domain-containing protein n=1 Tax=Apodospora peruviana TaxID=516989 RepID=A0AAE0IU46_9PEZI|nr:hypothetical protein B0H66DRAFT_573050 [Apodospora peruviana]
MRKYNVQSFPRPPAVERCPKHIQIKWHGQLIADCPPGEGYWVLETHHAPTYYIPASIVRIPISTTPRTTFCEWKGTATYYSMMSPINANEVIPNRIWSYNEPSKGYEPIKGFLAFYCGPWECYADGERAHPQPGDFYGGWITSDIEGVIKGQWGTWDPVLSC